MTQILTLIASIFIIHIPSSADCLLCYVCIPALTGNTQSQLLATRMRANISRTFPGKAESDFQECGVDFDKDLPNSQALCPWNDQSEVCLDIKHESWEARTCGRIPLELDLLCETTNDGRFSCPCTGPLCNSAPYKFGTLFMYTTFCILLSNIINIIW